jgi:dsRNA-specific ribonuclease
MAPSFLMTPENTPFNLRNKLLAEPDAARIICEYYPGTGVGDVNLYRKAMTHRSYCTRKNENFVEGNVLCPPGCIPLQEESNERLEFLGDAVLNLVVGAYLFERFPDDNEGFLTRMRTKLVNGGMLARLCSLSGLSQWFIISRQIDDSGGRSNKKVMEDIFEAFLGALYLDHGFQAAQAWIINFIEAHVDFTELIKQQENYKDLLAKYFQHAFHSSPNYVERHAESSTGKERHETTATPVAPVAPIASIASIASNSSNSNNNTSITAAANNSSNNTVSNFVSVCIKNKQGISIAMARAANRKAAEQEAARKALQYYGQLV